MLKRPKSLRKLTPEEATTLARNYSGARREDLVQSGIPGEREGISSHLRVAQEIHPTQQELTDTLSSGNYSLISPSLESNPELIPERYEALTRKLKDMGAYYTPAVGVYENRSAPVVLVYDLPVEALIELGKEFQQESVIYIRNGNSLKLFTWGPQQGEVQYGGKPTFMTGSEFTAVKTVDGNYFSFSFNFSEQFENSHQ